VAINGLRDTGEVASQYATEDNLRARQRLWSISKREPNFDLQRWVLELAALRGSESMLEVGCGNGRYLALVEAVGLDVSLGMLTAARAVAKGPVVCGDAEHLPFADASFDVVLAHHMLYHVADRPAAIRELRRVAKRDGRCIAVTNSAHNQAELVRLVEDAVGGGWKWLRRSTAGFSLENGSPQLELGFESVKRIDCPKSTVAVTDAEAVADYLLSLESEYRSEFPSWVAWADVVESCRQSLLRTIRDEGSFDVRLLVGAFVCR
jgi:SAM-dependent methyltransferase